MDDPDTLYSNDVISFARKIKAFSGKDEEFSFSDVYDKVTFSGARFCEARVWSFFSAVMGDEWSNQYLDYAQGYNLTNRMPLWVKPPGSDTDGGISVTDGNFSFINSFSLSLFLSFFPSLSPSLYPYLLL